MKKLLLLLSFLSIASGIFAQVSKTLNLATAGTLSTSLTSDELNTITNLTLTGTIDARDFKTMRSDMPLLAVLDLSGVTIAAYSGTLGASTDSYDYPDHAIPDYAFAQNRSLTTIVLPSSLSSIGKNAFLLCSGLTSVTIPSSVSSIGKDAFLNCSGLILITVDANNSTYSSLDGVLYDKTQTTLIQCPNGKIGSFTIPSSVTSIGENAFLLCSGLTSVTIPSSVTSIGKDAFLNCSGLILITVDANNSNYSSLDGVLYDKTQTTLIQCPIKKMGSFTIPSSVTSIREGAFNKCSGLTSVVIPSSVTSIGKNTFMKCSGFTSVTIPSSVTSIGDWAFYLCSGLTSVTIPSSVTSIGENAFDGCSGLTSVMIPSSVTSIGILAFESCTGLTSITMSRQTPLDLSSQFSVFSNVNRTTCTLYVPVGSKSFYQVASQWKDFKNIVEKDLTGINPMISDQQLTIYPNPTTGKVKIVFAKIPQRGATMTVNDFTGKTILTQLIQNKEEQIDLSGNSPGVYLIRTNSKDFKVQKVILK